MFQVKICGITTVEDAQFCAAAGADAIGLNFFAESPRFVTPQAAASIARAIPPGVVRIGVFVNAEVSTVFQISGEVGLDRVQLHGDEPPEYVAALAEAGLPPIVRAFRVGLSGLVPIVQYLQTCGQMRCLPAATLLDASVFGSYGGTGVSTDWTVAAEYRTGEGVPPLILAGGLTPENVSEAVRRVLPRGVDTASGVESSPGRKDPARVRAFVAAARLALAETVRARADARRHGE